MRVSPFIKLLRDNFAPCAYIDFSKKEHLHKRLNQLVREIQLNPKGDESRELSEILTAMSFPFFYRGIDPRDFHTALDLVQEFQTIAFKKILDGTLKPEGNIPSYLFAIERRVLQSYKYNLNRRISPDSPQDIPSVHGIDRSTRWRLTSRNNGINLDMVPANKGFDPAEQIAKLDLELRFGFILETALEVLSPRERVIFELRMFEGLTFSDIEKDPRAHCKGNKPVTVYHINRLYQKALRKVQDTFRLYALDV